MPGASCELDAGLKKVGTIMNLSSAAGTRKSEIFIPQRSCDHQPADQSPGVTATLLRDRAWWAAEAARTGTDWRSLGDAALEVLVSAGIIPLEPSFELACVEADRGRLPPPKRSGAAMAAPPTTIEALMLSLRRGVSELARPETQQRLSTLDQSQLESVCVRVQAFQPRIAPVWCADDVDLLISAWRKFREQR
jgi:hypothetical protein